MTIIAPLQTKSYKHFLIVLCALILGGGFVYIYEYTILVNARSTITNAKETIEKLEADNVTAQNELYAAVHPKKLETIAQEYTLLIESNPEFITPGKDGAYLAQGR